MKLLTSLILLVQINCSCSDNNIKKTDLKSNENLSKIAITTDSCKQTDSLFHLNDSLLLRFANSFTASSMDLNKSILPDFKKFLASLDTICLRKEKNYKLFISIILAKLYEYHENCCNQGYDLHGMKQGDAKLIINEFERLVGLSNENIEFLNSFRIIDYINGDPNLKQNQIVKKILRKIRYKGKQ